MKLSISEALNNIYALLIVNALGTAIVAIAIIVHIIEH